MAAGAVGLWTTVRLSISRDLEISLACTALLLQL